jgi:uncharacterized membrane protein
MVFAKSAERKEMDVKLSSPWNPGDVQALAPEGIVCPHCGNIIDRAAVFCPDCKWSLRPLSVSQRSLAAVAYLPLFPPALILLLPAFRHDRYVRFHAWQSLSLWILFFVVSGAALFLSNVAAAMIFLILGILASLAMLFLWIVLSIKAWQGVRFELPLVGKLAARMTNRY